MVYTFLDNGFQYGCGGLIFSKSDWNSQSLFNIASYPRFSFLAKLIVSCFRNNSSKPLSLVAKSYFYPSFSYLFYPKGSFLYSSQVYLFMKCGSWSNLNSFIPARMLWPFLIQVSCICSQKNSSKFSFFVSFTVSFGLITPQIIAILT